MDLLQTLCFQWTRRERRKRYEGMSNLEAVEPNPAPPPSQGTLSQIIRLDLATLISENIRPRPAIIHYVDIHLGV